MAKPKYWITDLVYHSDTWQVKGNLNYTEIPFTFSVPSNATGVVHIDINNKATNQYTRQYYIYPGNSTTISISENEVIDKVCFRNSSGWSGNSSIPFIKEIFPTTRPTLPQLTNDATLQEVVEYVGEAKGVLNSHLINMKNQVNNIINKLNKE